MSRTMKSEWQQSTLPLEFYTEQRNLTEDHKINALAVVGTQGRAGIAQAKIQ